MLIPVELCNKNVKTLIATIVRIFRVACLFLKVGDIIPISKDASDIDTEGPYMTILFPRVILIEIAFLMDDVFFVSLYQVHMCLKHYLSLCNAF